VVTTNLLLAQVNRVEKGNLVLEDIPEVPVQLSERLRQYQNIRSAALQDWTADSKAILISTRFGETSQLHFVRIPGGARQQITFFSEPVSGAMVNPDAQRAGFIFRKDVGGSEYYQLFYFDLTDGSTAMLTDGKSRNGGGVWSNRVIATLSPRPNATAATMTSTSGTSRIRKRLKWCQASPGSGTLPTGRPTTRNCCWGITFRSMNHTSTRLPCKSVL